MPHPRFYQATPFQINNEVTLHDNVAHHLARVLRLQVGANITLFNGDGGEYAASILQITKKAVTVKITAFTEDNKQSALDIHLGQALSKGERMDFVMQKATELGVTTITPIITEYCQVKLNKERMQKKLQHWQQVAISACEQSGRNILPLINMPCTIQDCVSQASEGKKIIFATDNRQHATEHNIAQSNTDNCDRMHLLIGPEGGFAPQEVTLAKQHGFICSSLGPRILRTETAALTAIALAQAKYGDLSSYI